jgi:hypothetical protein
MVRNRQREDAEVGFPPPAGHGTYAARRALSCSSNSIRDRYPRELWRRTLFIRVYPFKYEDSDLRNCGET